MVGMGMQAIRLVVTPAQTPAPHSPHCQTARRCRWGIPCWYRAPTGSCRSCCRSVFGVELESCARCGGRLSIIASIEEPEVIAKILAHMAHVSPEQYEADLPLGARAPLQQSSLI